MKILKDRIYSTLDRNQTGDQAGFRKGFSTVDHIQTINQFLIYLMKNFLSSYVLYKKILPASFFRPGFECSRLANYLILILGTFRLLLYVENFFFYKKIRNRLVSCESWRRTNASISITCSVLASLT